MTPGKVVGSGVLIHLPAGMSHPMYQKRPILIKNGAGPFVTESPSIEP